MKKYPLACHSTRDPFWYRYSNYLIFRTTRRIHSMQWHKVIYIYIPILSCSPLRMHMINTFCVCAFFTYIHTNIHTSIHPGHTYIRTKNLIYHPVTQYGVLENPAPQALGHNDLATSNLSQLWLWVVLRCYCVCEVAFLLIFIRMVTFVELD